MHEFKHPKYYTELRKRNREVLRSGRGLAVNQAPHVSDQAISSEDHDGDRERAPGQGLKQQAIEETVPHNDIEEATSSQASSGKRQAPSRKHQAPSRKRQAP